jgi:hypothetical protein
MRAILLQPAREAIHGTVIGLKTILRVASMHTYQYDRLKLACVVALNLIANSAVFSCFHSRQLGSELRNCECERPLAGRHPVSIQG